MKTVSNCKMFFVIIYVPFSLFSLALSLSLSLFLSFFLSRSLVISTLFISLFLSLSLSFSLSVFLYSIPIALSLFLSISLYLSLSLPLSLSLSHLLILFTLDIHSRTLRSSHETQLYIPKPRIELFRSTFVCSGSSSWNSIPDFIRNSSNLFKVRYLKWYQSSDQYSKVIQVSVSHLPDRFYHTRAFMKIMYFHNLIC